MNLHITKEQHERLCNTTYIEFIYGSHLFGTNTEESDKDVLRTYKYDDIFPEKNHLPNKHSFNYFDEENNIDYVWMTNDQFMQAKQYMKGDGTIPLDIFIFSGVFDIKPEYLYTNKIVKAYLGVAKRDITQHKGNKKKFFNACRCFIIAHTIMTSQIPDKETVIKDANFIFETLQPKDVLVKIDLLRKILTNLFNEDKIKNYYIHKSDDDLYNLLSDANNLKYIKY